MKKLIIASSALLLSVSLVGCHSMNEAGQYTSTTVGNGIKYGTNTVGNGLKYGVNTVGYGIGVVANTGAALGRGVGTVVGTGTGYVTGHRMTYNHHPMTYNHMNGYHQRNMIYRNGHSYMLHNGKYVLVR